MPCQYGLAPRTAEDGAEGGRRAGSPMHDGSGAGVLVDPRVGREHAPDLDPGHDEVDAVEDAHPPHRRAAATGRAPRRRPSGRVVQVEGDDHERRHQRQEREDRVALLERQEPLDPEDRAQRRGQAQAAGHDREEDVADDQQAPLEAGVVPKTSQPGGRASERGDGADRRRRTEQEPEPGLERARHRRAISGRPRRAASPRAEGHGERCQVEPGRSSASLRPPRSRGRGRARAARVPYSG